MMLNFKQVFQVGPLDQGFWPDMPCENSCTDKQQPIDEPQLKPGW